MKNAIERYLEIKFEQSEVAAHEYCLAAIALMDDDIREDLHEKLASCSESEFLESYCEAHVLKFGEEFEIY